MKVSKNKLIKYMFILSLLWSFLLLEPILLQSYATQNAAKQDSKQGRNEYAQENILTNQNLDFYETVGQMSKTIAHALSNAGYSAQVYYDEATFVRTEKHLIIIGHGSKISDRYSIEDMLPETIIRLASQFEFIALLACKSSEIMKSSQTILSFVDDISTIEALKHLSEFLKMKLEIPKNMKKFNLYDPIPGLDPGPGGGGGDPLGEGWVSQTASVTYDSIWYYFNLKTVTGATEFDLFVQSHPSVYVQMYFRGYFNYFDPEDPSACGWIEYEDGELISVILTFKVRIVWAEVTIPGGTEIHAFLSGSDYKYNGQTDPRSSYSLTDLNDSDCNQALLDYYGSAAAICATFAVSTATLGIPIFILGTRVATWSVAMIFGQSVSYALLLQWIGVVLIVVAIITFIASIYYLVKWSLEASGC